MDEMNFVLLFQVTMTIPQFQRWAYYDDLRCWGD